MTLSKTIEEVEYEAETHTKQSPASQVQERSKGMFPALNHAVVRMLSAAQPVETLERFDCTSVNYVAWNENFLIQEN